MRYNPKPQLGIAADEQVRRDTGARQTLVKPVGDFDYAAHCRPVPRSDQEYGARRGIAYHFWITNHACSFPALSSVKREGSRSTRCGDSRTQPAAHEFHLSATMTLLRQG